MNITKKASIFYSLKQEMHGQPEKRKSLRHIESNMIEKEIQWIKNNTIPGRSYDALVEFNKKKTKNIVISGTNFWNPGDDFVRDGVINILRKLFDGYSFNFLFYNFNADFFPQSKFSGISNTVSKGDLDKYRQFIDAVVVAGLSAGTEIKDLYNWVIANGLQDRVYWMKEEI